MPPSRRAKDDSDNSNDKDRSARARGLELNRGPSASAARPLGAPDRRVEGAIADHRNYWIFAGHSFLYQSEPLDAVLKLRVKFNLVRFGFPARHLHFEASIRRLCMKETCNQISYVLVIADMITQQLC